MEKSAGPRSSGSNLSRLGFETMKRNLPWDILILLCAIMYWIVSFSAAHRATANLLYTHETGDGGPASPGSLSVMAKWPHATLAHAAFFAESPEMLENLDVGAFEIHVESPIGKPLEKSNYRISRNYPKILSVDFDPPLATGSSVRITLNSPSSIQWTNQRASVGQVLPQGAHSVPGALLLPEPYGPDLLLLGSLGGLFAVATIGGLSKNRFFLPIFFFLIVGAMLALSARSGEARIWLWPHEYWPDGYVKQAHALLDWISGETPFAQTGLQKFRNGQSWIVSFVLALLMNAGLPASNAYFFISSLSVCSALALITFYLHRLTNHPLLAAAFLGIAASSVPVLRSATAFVNDGAALLTLAVFLVAFVSFLKNPKSTWMLLGLSLTIAVSCQVRVAMLPLVFAPMATGFGVILFSFITPDATKMPWKLGLRLAAPGILAAGLVVVSWSILGVLHTVIKAGAFARSALFTSHFTWLEFAEKTLCSTFPLLVIFISAWVFRNGPKFRWPAHFGMAISLIILAFLAMMAAGHIIPWHRYWAPIALTSALLSASLTFSLPNFFTKAILIACLLFNGFLVINIRYL